LLRNARKRDKEIEQNNRGREEKKRRKKRPHFLCFVMSDEPRWIFAKKRFCFCRVFELPFLRNAQKHAIKKIDDKIKIKQVPSLFWGCGKCMSLSSIFFTAPPCLCLILPHVICGARKNARWSKRGGS
jgi:hypothetical protein